MPSRTRSESAPARGDDDGRPEPFDEALRRLRAGLVRRGVRVTGLTLGEAGDLRIRCRLPSVEVILEDAADTAPAGPSLPFGRFRLVALTRGVDTRAAAPLLLAAHEAFAEEWPTRLARWLEPRPGRAPAPGHPFWGAWRVEAADAGSGATMRLRSPRGAVPLALDAARRATPLGDGGSPEIDREAARLARVVTFLMRRGALVPPAPAETATTPGEPPRPREPVAAARPVGSSAAVDAGPVAPTVPWWESAPRRLPPDEVRVALLTSLDCGAFLTLRRPPFASLGPARVVGYLESRGLRAVTHHELTVAVERRLRASRGELDLSPFADEGAVDAFLLRSAPGPVQTIVDELLDWATLPPADLFGLSLVRQYADHPQAELLLALDLCLVHGLKRRHPGSVTVLGGLNFVAIQSIRDCLLGLLRRCPSLDFAVEGAGEVALHNILRAVFAGEDLVALGQPHERTGGQYRLYATSAAAAPAARGPRPNPRKEDLALAGGYPLSAYQELPRATPAFANADDYGLSGRELADLYAFPPELRRELGPHLERRIVPLTLQFMTGCSCICSFCAAGNVEPRALAVEEVVRQVASLRERYGASHFIFTNNAVNWSYDYATRLAAALTEAVPGVLWTDSLMLNNLDERLVARLRESGLVRADVGVEVASQRLRSAMRKPLATKRVAERLRLLRRYGIWCDINMIVGFPHEDRRDLDETRAFLEETAGDYMTCTFNPFGFVDISPMGHRPAAFGITARPGRQLTELGWRVAFDEVGGLTFEERERWGTEAAAELRALVEALGPPPFCSSSNSIPFHLIFFLYEALGHGQSARIRRLYGELRPRLGGRPRGDRPLVVGPLDPREVTVVP